MDWILQRLWDLRRGVSARRDGDDLVVSAQLISANHASAAAAMLAGRANRNARGF
jgi:hypothetical protein